MDFDNDKINEQTLTHPYLVAHDRHEGLEARAWKGFDRETLNRLHEKGYIADPVGKAKSVGMSGFLRANFLKNIRGVNLISSAKPSCATAWTKSAD